MTKLVQVRKLELVAIEPDQVGLDIEAALSNNEGGEDNHAIKNTTFDVRVGVQKVYEGKSDAKTGVFSAKNIPIGEVGSQVDVVISGNDGVDSTSFEITLNTESVMMRIADMRREREAAVVIVKPEPAKEEPKLSHAEEAEKQRQLKESIKNALRDTGSDNRHVAEAAFRMLVEHQDHPLIDREIYNTAEAHSEQFIQHAQLFYEASWGKYVLDILSKKEPKRILGKFHEFSKYDFAEYIVARIVIYHCSDLAFSEIETYEFMPWAEGLAMRAAQDNPDSAIAHYDKYRDQPWAERVLAQAKLAQSEYEAKIEMWKKISAAREIFGQPHNEADLVNAFSLFVEHQNEHGMERIMCSLAEYYPDEFLKYKESYKQAVWGKTVIDVASSARVIKTVNSYRQMLLNPHDESTAARAFAFFIAFTHNSKMASTLEEMARENPECFLKNHSLYKEAAWGERVFEIAKGEAEQRAKERSEKIGQGIEEFGQIFWQPHSEEDEVRAFNFFVEHQHDEEVGNFLAEHVASNCMLFIRHFDLYQDAAWCDRIHKILIKHLPAAEHIKNTRIWRKKFEADPVNTVGEILLHHQGEKWLEQLLFWISGEYPDGVVTKKFVSGLGVSVGKNYKFLIKPNPIWAYFKREFNL